jgi:hypothetical protein
MMVVDVQFYGSDWKTEEVSFSFNLGRPSLHGRLRPFFILRSGVTETADLEVDGQRRWGSS